MKDDFYAVVVSCSDYECVININGTRYVYSSYSYNGYELKNKFESMSKHSEKKAVNWIKENARVITKYSPE